MKERIIKNMKTKEQAQIELNQWLVKYYTMIYSKVGKGVK